MPTLAVGMLIRRGLRIHQSNLRPVERPKSVVPKCGFEGQAMPGCIGWIRVHLTGLRFLYRQAADNSAIVLLTLRVRKNVATKVQEA